MEDITEALWGSNVSPSTISELNKKTLSILRTGGTAPCRVAGILMCLCIVFTASELGR